VKIAFVCFRSALVELNGLTGRMGGNYSTVSRFTGFYLLSN